MPHKSKKLISLFISFCLILEQSVLPTGRQVFAQSIDLSHYFANSAKPVFQSDKFRPLHLRYLGYDNLSQDFKLLLDQGDTKKEDLENKTYIEENTQTLLKYFFIGLSLPNDKFWVNLRPDAPENIIDDDLAKTDVGKILLEADLQLKKDTASFTSPQTPEGKVYWDKLYKKAGELFGTENITIPTLTRPWIVPGEIIIREAPDNAYIYKATLKVMLEEDYLSNQKTEELKNQRTAYNFSDPRLKELNQYSTQLIKELIIPKLTYQVNTSKRYAPLRQVYYSLILAQWFKARYRSQSTEYRAQRTEDRKANNYLRLIDSGNLTNLILKEPYDKQAYFRQYQKSFQDGEYNLQEIVRTPYGQSIRRYVSGGANLSAGSGIEAGRIMTPDDKPLPKNKYLSSPIIYGPDGRIIGGKQHLVLPFGGSNDLNPATKGILGPDGKLLNVEPPKGKNPEIKFPSKEEIAKYGKTAIPGIDEETLAKVKAWIDTQGEMLIAAGVAMKVIIDQYLGAMRIKKREDGQAVNIIDYLNTIKEKKDSDMPTEDIEKIRDVAKRLEYLLHPDIKRFAAQLDSDWADMLFGCYRIDGIMTDRSMALIIGYLETAGGNPALRQKLRNMLTLANPDLFDGASLKRLKAISLYFREDIFSRLPGKIKKEVEKIWTEEDNAIREKIKTINKPFAELSEQEFKELLQGVKATGSEAFYNGEIPPPAYPNPYDRTFGVEVETVKPEDKNVYAESRFPGEAEGYIKNTKNLNALKKLFEESISGNVDKMGIHIHISREGMSNSAFNRVIVGWEAVLRLFGYSVLSNTDRQLSPSIEYFFSTENKGINEHTVYINESRGHPTIEFRFARNPIYYEDKKMDMEFFVFFVELGMRLIDLSVERPEDFTFLKMGIPVVYGKEKIHYSYVVKVIDLLYKDDPKARISFLRFMLFRGMDKEGNMYLPRLVMPQNEHSDDSMEERYVREGLGFIYGLHDIEKGWNKNIWETIKRLAKEGGGEYKYSNQMNFCLLFLYYRSDSQDEKKNIQEILEGGQFYFFDEIRNIKDEALRNNFVKYALPNLLGASANRPEDFIKALLTLADGIKDEALRNNFVEYALSNLLGASANRPEDEILRLAKESYNRLVIDNVAHSASSSLANKGGIAFNALPIRTEAVASSALGSFPGTKAFQGDLDAEWAQIQAVFNAGIRPSVQRISEYTAAVAGRGGTRSAPTDEKIDQVRGMLADILRRDEEDEKLPATQPAVKKLLSALELR